MSDQPIQSPVAALAALPPALIVKLRVALDMHGISGALHCFCKLVGLRGVWDLIPFLRERLCPEAKAALDSVPEAYQSHAVLRLASSSLDFLFGCKDGDDGVRRALQRCRALELDPLLGYDYTHDHVVAFPVCRPAVSDPAFEKAHDLLASLEIKIDDPLPEELVTVVRKGLENMTMNEYHGVLFFFSDWVSMCVNVERMVGALAFSYEIHDLETARVTKMFGKPLLSDPNRRRADVHFIFTIDELLRTARGHKPAAPENRCEERKGDRRPVEDAVNKAAPLADAVCQECDTKLEYEGAVAVLRQITEAALIDAHQHGFVLPDKDEEIGLGHWWALFGSSSDLSIMEIANASAHDNFCKPPWFDDMFEDEDEDEEDDS